METARDKANWRLRDHMIEDFLQACKEAVQDEEKFKIFKQDSRITHIFEHCSKNIAQNYLENIDKSNPNLLDRRNKFWDNDNIGNPKIMDFIIGKRLTLWRCSTSTLQYIGVLSNLITQFNSLDNFKIVEIGGGYGGQCKIITDAFKIKKYHIFDLEEVMELQSEYLDKLSVTDKTDLHLTVPFITPEKEVILLDDREGYDLVISNYALTEILEPLQTAYVDKILLNSKHGYITCNGKINAIDKLKEKFPTFKLSNDIEGESLENYIITW